MKMRKKKCCKDLNVAKVVGLMGAAGVCGLAGIIAGRRCPITGAFLGTVIGAAVGLGFSEVIERLANVKPYRKLSPHYGDYDTESGL